MSHFDEFPIGSIAYYVKTVASGAWIPSFGIVHDHCGDGIDLELYDLSDNRTIDGVPIQEIEFPTKWQKLPKGWTWNTELFKLGYSERSESTHRYTTINPDDMLKAIEEGTLVRVQDRDYGRIETEIDTKKGWRICLKYSISDFHSTHITTLQVYKTYDEALQEIKRRTDELKRQAELSDYDWSVEKIDEVLARWSNIYHIDNETKEKYRQWILDLDNVEDIEARVFDGNIQWKYWKNKHWNNIEL